MKFKRNPSASPIFSKQSPVRQEVDPPAETENKFSDMDVYDQLYNKASTEVREGLGRKAEGAVTTIEKKNEGMQRVFEAIKSGADKEEITNIVREHNRELYGTVKSGEVVKHKGFANAKIGLKEAFGYMPKDTVDKVTQEKKEEKRGDYGSAWSSNLTTTNEEGDVTGKIIKNPNYNPNFQGDVSKLKERNEYIVSKNPSENNPIQRAGFKKLKFGRRN